MIYGSVCSGIEAATVAWHPLGWKPAFLSEIAPFPRAVLAHHYPDVPLYSDFTVLRDDVEKVADIDVLVGGTPCQAFSIAGFRRSLEDDRGNLTLEFVRLADAIDDFRRSAGKPGLVIVWENVPGVLNTKDNAFGCFLGGLAGENVPLEPPGGKWSNAGYVLGPTRAIAWRVLDAQYFGLAQRRRRVFVVACPGDGADPREILFERQGVRRDTPPRDSTRVAANVANQGDPTAAGVFNVSTFQSSQSGFRIGGGVHPTLDSNNGSRRHHGVIFGGRLRRLCPVECERIQGFPDAYTNIVTGTTEASDSVRYKAIGNSMAVSVMRWIGRQIKDAYCDDRQMFP